MSEFLNKTKYGYLTNNRVLIIDKNKEISASNITDTQLGNVSKIVTSGDGNKYLSDDGTYKEMSSIEGQYLPLAGGKLTGDLYIDNMQNNSSNGNKIIFSKNGVNYAGIGSNISSQLVIGTFDTNGTLDTTKSIYYDIRSTTLFPGTQNKTFQIGSVSTPIKAIYAENLQGDLTGNADTATTATNANKVKVTDTSPTTSTSYRMVFSSATATGNTDLRINNNDTSLIILEGTESAIGYNILTLGNATASGAAGNKQGKLRVYSQGAGYNELVSSKSDSNFVNTLPASTGTLINSNGGTLTGKLVASQGVRVATLSGGAGTGGWMKVCTITIGNVYQNQYIVIGFVQRARFGKLYIGFSSSNNLTPTLTRFNKSGLDIQARIVKTDDSVWDVYVAKQEAYDNIEIVQFDKGSYMDKTTVKWIGTSHATLPDTTEFPTYKDATTWDLNMNNYKSYVLPITGGTLSGNLYFNHTSANNSGVIGWNSGTVQQRLVIDDNSTTADNVFTFQQSTNSGTNWTSLLVINDDSSIETQRLISSLSTGTYLAGSQGKAIINSMSGSGAYTTIFKTNSTNGRFTMSNYQTNLLVGYQTNSSVSAGTNALTKQITLLNESGNTTFPGLVTCTGGISVQGHRVFVQSGKPSGAKTGDVWIDIP